MKNIIVLFLLFILSLTSFACAASTEKFGLAIGDAVLLPGEKKESIFAFFGVPDSMYAMRGKGSKKNDYIKLYYQEYELSFDLTNEDNTIKAIILKGSFKLINIPFKVGDTYDSVKAKWGEPDKKEAGYANYLRNGVMFKVSDKGLIELIAIFLPGKIDLTPPSQAEPA